MEMVWEAGMGRGVPLLEGPYKKSLDFPKPTSVSIDELLIFLVGVEPNDRMILGWVLGFPTHEPRKKPYYFPLYWLVYKDPYNGLL